MNRRLESYRVSRDVECHGKPMIHSWVRLYDAANVQSLLDAIMGGEL